MADPKKVSELSLLATPSRDDYLIVNDAAGPTTYRAAISRIAPLPLAACTPLDQSTWAWSNQGGATVAQADGIVTLSVPASSGEIHRCRVVTAPAVPYTITAALITDLRPSAESRLGLCWRLSSDAAKLESLVARGGSEILHATFPSQANYVGAAGIGTVTYAALPALVWLRLVDDGTNRKALCSLDGVNFRELTSRARATFFGAAPDQVGICGLSNTTPYTLGTFFSWVVS